MAKDEIDRASRAGVEEVAVASKQHDAADLLKKMKVLPDADEKAPATESDHEHAVSDQQTASSDQTASASDSGAAVDGATAARSEEHTSELQSLMRISYAVFCLTKKKKYKNKNNTTT